MLFRSCQQSWNNCQALKTNLGFSRTAGRSRLSGIISEEGVDRYFYLLARVRRRGLSRRRWSLGVLLSSTKTLLESKLTTARSSFPSPLKSPTATDDGTLPAAKFRAAWKVPSPLPSSTETLLEFKLTTEIYTIAYTLSLHDALPISRIEG